MMRLFIFLLPFCFGSLITFGQTPSLYKNEFGFKTENDAYVAIKQDRYYTNGLFLFFRSALKPSEKQDTSKLTKKIWSLSAGQKMYNAQSGYVPNIDYIDRPFAGYLYGSTSLQWLFKNENIFKAEIQGGILGPSALGEEGQELYHDIFGFYELNGWQYQVKDEVALNLILNYDRLLYRSASGKNDFSLPVEARIGNTFSGLKTGILFRTGSLNPLYHSASTQSHVATYKAAHVKDKELYFFLKPSLDLVLYDATISGGLFRKDKGEVTFDTKPLVFSQELGVAYSQKRWTANFSLIFKSKEVKSAAKAHQYGIIDIFYRFN
jgi:lipid A 3-O-deacylase